MNKEDKIKELEEELEKTKQELIETKEHLKKYTAPTRSKKYYENHKEEVIQKVKEHKKKTNYTYLATPDQKKRMGKNRLFK
jgi:hypothetical protein